MMKRGTIMLVMTSMFLIFLASPVGDMMASSMEPYGFATNRSIISDGENAFTGKGVELSVQFNGVFFNGTSWSDTNKTLAEDLTSGSTFSVSNDSVTDWSAYVLVSPPYNISSMNFTVTKPPSMTGSKSWNLTGVTDPDGDSRLSEVTDSATEVTVPTAAVDVFGLWKFEFNQTNGATNLQCGINGGSYATTFTYDVGDSASFRAYAPDTTGSAMRLILTGPDNETYYSTTDSTQHITEHYFEWPLITVLSSWPAGVWHADVNFNDTGGAAPKFVGRYKRSFIIKHDTSLTLQSPGDAVSDKLSVRTAGEMLYVEVQLMDDDNSQAVTGATVTMNWTVSGVPTDITLEDYGDGTYGKALNTSDLEEAKRWRIEIDSYHQYYNNATTYFDLDLFHSTELTYTSLSTTPVGSDSTVTLVYRDTYDNAPIVGATITFANGTPANVVAEGGGQYNLSVNTGSLGLGDHWYIFNASKPGSLVEMASTNIMFTMRKHYTSVTVIGDLVTPHGQTTPVTVVITDLDTGTDLGTTTDVDSWSFTSGYAPVTETPPPDFDVTLTTATWLVGPETVTLSVTMSGIYENPSIYQFDVEIRKHYTSVTVIGDLVTPYGQMTPVTVVITDLDTGTELSSTSSITSWSFTSTNPAVIETPPADFDVTLTTDTWSVGPETVTLTVTMGGIYENPSIYQFNIQIRNHYTSVSVSGGLVTPFGNVTPLTIIVTDLDTATTLSASDLSAFTFTSSYSPYSENNPTDLDLDLPTNAWIVGIETVTLSVTMTGNYNNPTSYEFDITIRSMSTYMYNEPSDLVFPSGDDFEIYLRVNVSEPGTSYGLPVTALTQGEFSVESYTISIDTTGQSVGRYKLTIAGSNFPDGDFTITVHVDPNNQNHASAILVISFTFRPARSFLSSPNYPQVTTPFEMDVQITLNYTDVDRELGIDDATIGNESINIHTVIDALDGTYTLWIDVAGLSEGPHEFNLTANKDGYEFKYLTFTVLIRVAYTYAIPTVGALDIPVGNDPQFYVEYWDIDHDVPVEGASWVSDWDHPLTVVYDGGEERYQVTLPTWETDALRQNYVVNITFYKDNYQNGTFTISITIRTHNTDFRLVSAVEPTSYIGMINISVYYGDLDNPEGIKSHYVKFRVENASGLVISEPYNDTTLGPGFYILRISAAQFGQGVQTFTVYVNWTGPIYTYQNRTLVATANIVGVESSLTLLIASEPTPYLGNMSYIFFYSDVTSGLGIDNSTYDVHIYVSFQGESVDLSLVDIWEVDQSGQPGNYSIEFNTTMFGHTGLIYMNVYINWSKGVAPFYANRTDVISVRILPRDTIISITPPSPTSYNENATFVFYFEDVTGGLNEPIADDLALSIALNLTEDPAVTYNPIEKSFTVSFNTSQFGSPLGTRAFTLNVTWAGAPFYANRTGRIIYITVMERQTVVEYLAPAPTPYRDNVTFIVIWTDVTGAGSTGIDGANLVLLDGATPIGATYYSVTPLGNGEYEVELNTTYYTEPGTNDLVVELSAGVFYILDKSVSREFNVRQRITLLSAEPVAKVAYNSSIEIILYYQDLYTLDDIGNASGLTSLEILTPGVWLFTCEWNGTFGYYVLTVETHNHPELLVDTPYMLHLNITYAIQAPFYGPDDTYVTFELRERASSLDIEEPPDPTPYLDYAVFQVYYRDVDGSAGIVIGIDDISLEKGGVPLMQGTEYLITDNGAGYYIISVNTTALDGLGITAVDVFATWTGGSPYHEDADMTVSIRVTKRETNVEITVPPSITQYLDNVTFTFAYTDLLRGTAITSITASDIELWADGVPLSGADFMMSQMGGSFLISVNSTILSANLVSNYNLTVKVDWNDAMPPFYSDDTTLVRVTTTNRVITYSIDAVQDAGLGENISISFSLSDEDTGVPVGGVIIDFDGQTVSLTRDVDFWVIEGSGVDLGKYTIYVDSLALFDPGTYDFNLDVSWNPSTQPYYANMSTIVLTGIVRAIETNLIPVADQVTVLWKEGAIVSVNYQNILYGNLTSGASVNWTWPGIAQGSFVEIGTTGIYNATIDTSLDYAGTIVLIIVAEKDRYQLAIAYVTIVVRSLPSKVVGIDPADLVLDINRGGAVDITVYLNDTVFAVPIPDIYVTQVRADFEGESYYLVYNGTPGYYTTVIPGAGPTILPPAAYDVRLVAVMVNYEPAAYLFKIHLSQTRTELLLVGDTTEDMSKFYTELVELRVDLVLPDIGYASFPNATVSWHISELGADGNFTSMGNGTYYIVFNTTNIGFGIWPISFRAQPWLNASEHAASATQITLNIKRIATIVEREASEIDLVWGWSGYLRFNYTGTFGLIPNAAGAYTVGTFQGNAIDLGNGTYLVPLDSTALGAGSTYTLNILFTRENYQEGPSSVKVNVVPVPMELVIDIHSDYEDPINPTQYRVPYGMLINITLLYNDTDSSDGYVGGLENANLTLSEMRGPTRQLTTFAIEALGNGYYSYLFDTTDPWLFEQISTGEPGPQMDPYILTFRLTLANRTTITREVKITIIALPTSVEKVSADTSLEYGQTGQMVVMFVDEWDGHPPGTLITGANFTVDDSTILQLLEIIDTYEDPTRPGYYIIEYRAASILFGTAIGLSSVDIVLRLPNVQEGKLDDPLLVTVTPTTIAQTLNTVFVVGTPLLLIIVMLLVAYLKVWSVPKRIRQINGQVKALRKGKIPKPVDDVKGRSELIAELFNDTFSDLAITRVAAQMPEESVMVVIPEMGELLIQLAILTNLDQVELDEFKADISKMKTSEQAAFVKEVIHQEAIRAARSEGKEIDEILKTVEDQARKDLSDGVDEEIVEEDVVAEPKILTKEEEKPEVEPKPGKRIPSDVRKEFEVSSDIDKLSTFELENLRMDLVRRGIQAHEIETIMEQARELPRDLVDELLKSFGLDEE